MHSSKKPRKATILVSKYFIVGISITIINYLLYTFIIRVILNNNNDLLWLSTIISCVIVTFIAFGLHSKITWRENSPGKYGIIKFFIWNFLIAFLISPLITWFFTQLKPIYDFAFNISSAMHLPFDKNFIESTGVFCFTGFTTMILNFFFYDKFVFGNLKSNKSNHQKIKKIPINKEESHTDYTDDTI